MSSNKKTSISSSFNHPSTTPPKVIPLGGGPQRGNNVNNNNQLQRKDSVTSKKNQTNYNSYVTIPSNTQQGANKNTQAINKQKEMMKTMSQNSIKENQVSSTGNTNVSINSIHQDKISKQLNGQQSELVSMEFTNSSNKRSRESNGSLLRSSDVSSISGHTVNKKIATDQDQNQEEQYEEGQQRLNQENQQRKENNQERLNAVKILIRHSVVPQFSHPRALLKEIIRCKKVSPVNIKFANLKGCMIIIATDDPQTHEELSSQWPADAFIQGVIFATPRKDMQAKIVIRGFPMQADLEQEDIEDLMSQGIVNPTKLFNNKTSQWTNILKATANNQESLKEYLKMESKLDSPSTKSSKTKGYTSATSVRRLVTQQVYAKARSKFVQNALDHIHSKNA